MRKEFRYGRRNFFTALILTLAASWLITVGFSKQNSHQSNLSYMQMKGNELSSLKKADSWINSKSITASDLKGKVVLIEFGTYTCINWLRTLPYIRGWDKKYKDKGLVVITVHTPEFPFEKNIDNVRRAIKDLKIDLPVAIDNQQDIWNAFSNQYWPALYLIDTKGRIRHQQFGEGGYEQSEKIIQQLLAEAGVKDVGEDMIPFDGQGIEAAADWSSLNSAENYLGYERTENFVAPDFFGNGKHNNYTTPAQLRLNQWALSGDWSVQKGLIVLNKANGRIVYRFHARDLHLVMGPTMPGKSVRFRILIDGKAPATAHGIDIDEQGNGIITYQRMYQLIRQVKPVTDHVFEIEFLDEGVEAFAFTFG